MDTKKVATEYRLSQWAQMIQTKLNNGQNVKDFCQSSGISKHTYFYWQRKLREAACKELAKTEEHTNIIPSGWMQLKPKHEPHENESLDIEVNNCHVTVKADTDPELLKKVCNILRSL